MSEFNINKSMRNLKEYLRWDEVKRVMDATKRERDRLLIMTLAYTGRRITEVLLFTPRGILLDRQMGIFVVLKKGSPHQEIFPLNKELFKDLVIYIKNNNVLNDNRIFNISYDRAYQIVRRAGKDAGIEKVDKHFMHPHIFRHSFAIHYLETHKNKADALQKLKQLLAHEDISTTSIYAQFMQTDLKEDIDMM